MNPLLFEIIDNTKKLIYTLTNVDTEINFNNQIYVPAVSVKSIQDLNISSKTIFIEINLLRTVKIKENYKIRICKIENNLKKVMFYGYISEVQQNQNDMTGIKCISFLSKLFTKKGDFFSSYCKSQLCDSACKISSQTIASSGVVTSVNTNSITGTHPDFSDDYFADGFITFQAQEPSTFKIYSHKKDKITLFQNIKDIAISTPYTIIAGCDKSILTCKNKFNNIANFNGEVLA